MSSPIARLSPLALACLALGAHAQETVLPTVDIVGQRPPLSTAAPDRAYATSTAGGEAVKILGGAAQTSPYKALEFMPSVNLSGQDAYGLTVDQNFLRIRGLSAYTFSNLAMTVSGVPSGVNVGNGGMGNLYDLENVDAVTLTRGPMAADQGLGFGNLAGAMDVQLRAPGEHLGALVRTAVGSEGFHKVFTRIDTGTFGSGTRAFVSVSDAETDKWRGAGRQSRFNTTFGVSQDFDGGHRLEVYGVQNEFDRNEYRPLTYAQSQDLGTYRDLDYNTRLTGTAAFDALYDDYNRQTFTEQNVFAKLTLQLGQDTSLAVKPYWLNTHGYRLTGSGTTVNRIDIDQDQTGVVTELHHRLGELDLTAGYWKQRIGTIPPPLSQKAYSPNSSGALTFTRWGILADMGKRDYDSPYLQLNGAHAGLRYSAGVRYLRVKVPGISTYTAGSIGDVDRDDALARNPALNAALSTDASTYSAALPSASLQWDLDAQTQARVAYGRTVGNPWMGPLYSTYMSNLTKFQAAKVSLQDLWNRLGLERADTLDLGLNWQSRSVSVAPTVYVSRIRNKQVSAYDPAVGLAYPQSGVGARAWGVEVESAWTVQPSLRLLGSLSWNVNKLTDDIASGSGAVLATSGKQVTDAPRWLAKLGVDWKQGPWRVTPVVRHLGSRWGDAQNTERVDAYTVADLHTSWEMGKSEFLSGLEVGLSVQNLFDKRYIGSINAGQDDARPGATTYYPGAPRTVSLAVTGKF